MSQETVNIYCIWAWRVPYKARFAILIDRVSSGEIISNPTAIRTADELRDLQLYLENRGLSKLMPQGEDHPSLMETWI